MGVSGLLLGFFFLGLLLFSGLFAIGLGLLLLGLLLWWVFGEGQQEVADVEGLQVLTEL